MFFTGSVLAREFMIYPAQGQSNEQMEGDKFQCYGWAKNNSGFDPMQASAPAAPQQSQQGGLLRGGARGAAVGAAVGAIAGDAGKGAAIGAASGGMIGGMRRRDSQRQQDQVNQQVQQNYNEARANYDRAYSACLEGRGYTVK
ncbi:MAG: hypothetical protein KAQ91_06245 [Methylococcales bacterium]|nr:hypothetical protein [Methylococcales bacterium]